MTDGPNSGPDLSQPVTVSGANEPLNVLDAGSLQVSHGAERAIVGMVDKQGIKPGEGVNALPLSMLDATARVYTAHNALEANKGPTQPAPGIQPKKPDGPA